MHRDLLKQAQQLAKKERTRPKQASLRRAVSSAYYALFHLLINESVRCIVADDQMRKILSRAFIHGEMSKASKSFAGGTLPARYNAVVGGTVVPPQLQSVASAFVDLQQARHEADYNLAKSFSKAEAQALVDQVDQAFKDWQLVRNNRMAKFYLLCLLLNDRWEKVK